jgi:hypothetical protein
MGKIYRTPAHAALQLFGPLKNRLIAILEVSQKTPKKFKTKQLSRKCKLFVNFHRPQTLENTEKHPRKKNCKKCKPHIPLAPQLFGRNTSPPLGGGREGLKNV